MEFLLLAKVGMIIDWVVKGGYAISGIYLAKTGVTYYRDYLHYSKQEEVK